MQAGKLKYVTVFLVISVVFFFFDLADDVIERVLAKSDLELGIEALMRMTKGR